MKESRVCTSARRRRPGGQHRNFPLKSTSFMWTSHSNACSPSCMPEMYRDLRTAGKGMYKIEPAVADGGEVVIYSPQLREVSYSHGKLIEEIGYHCRDYSVKQ